MNRKLLFAASLLLAGCAGLADDVQVKHLGNKEILVQCEDEHEPVLHELPNRTQVLVTCEAK